jgi:dTDP-4-amino-4,6-dideoxygalactose transaminase
MNTNALIPYHRPYIGQEEIDSVVETLRSGWLTTGPRTALFEQDFRSYVQAPHALAVNSCTAGLHLALVALGIGPGDEVITTPLTFCATVNVIIQVGAEPVLADIGPDGNIDPDHIRAKITPRTRAVIPVHFGGLPCNMDAIWQIARDHGLLVIEDAAHALGTHYRGHPIGGGDPVRGYLSDAVVFSFYATKSLTTGEGGMVVSHREETIERIRRLCLHGIGKDAWDRYSDRGTWYYEVVECGFKCNLSDIQSAIGIPQLRKQEQFVRARTDIARLYTERLSHVQEVECPPDAVDGRHCWHLYSLRIREDRLTISRAQFIEELRSRGIGASVHFIPIPLHPYFTMYADLRKNMCPGALDLYPRLISLPIYPSMTSDEAHRVADAVSDIARKYATAECAGVFAAQR